MKKLAVLVVVLFAIAAMVACTPAKRVPYTMADISPKFADMGKDPKMDFCKIANLTYPATEIPSVDEFLKKANKIPATIIVAKEMIKKFKADLAGVAAVPDFKLAVEDLKKNKDKMTGKADQLKGMVETVKNVGELLLSLKDQGTALIGEGQALVTKVPADLAKDPKNAMKVGTVGTALKDTVSALQAGVAEIPELAKEIAGIADVVTGLF